MRLIFSTFIRIAPALGAALLSFFVIPAAAQDVAPLSSSMAAGSIAEPPQGYLAFCGRHSDQCGRAGTYMAESAKSRAVAMSAGDDSVHPASTSPGISSQKFDWQGVFTPVAVNKDARSTSLGSVSGMPKTASSFPAMTAELWQQLETANRVVNVGVRSVSDVTHYGVQDFWELPFQGGGNAGDCEDYVLQKRQMLLARGVPMAALSIALVKTSWGEEHAVLLVRSAQGDYVLDNLTPWIKPWTAVSYNWIKWQSGDNPEVWVRPPVR
jgi:predicted transglutaminase-like cysteine proteinase